MTYFPNVAGGIATPVTLYESHSYTSIYSGHIRQIVEHCVISAFGVRRAELRAPNRCRAQVALARQMAMYLAHVACGLSLTDAGKLLQRDRTTIAHGCGVIEDLRDDPVIDQALTVLEAVLASLLRVSLKESA